MNEIYVSSSLQNLNANDGSGVARSGTSKRLPQRQGSKGKSGSSASGSPARALGSTGTSKKSSPGKKSSQGKRGKRAVKDKSGKAGVRHATMEEVMSEASLVLDSSRKVGPKKGKGGKSANTQSRRQGGRNKSSTSLSVPAPSTTSQHSELGAAAVSVDVPEENKVEDHDTATSSAVERGTSDINSVTQPFESPDLSSVSATRDPPSERDIEEPVDIALAPEEEEFMAADRTSSIAMSDDDLRSAALVGPTMSMTRSQFHAHADADRKTAQLPPIHPGEPSKPSELNIHVALGSLKDASSAGLSVATTTGAMTPTHSGDVMTPSPEMEPEPSGFERDAASMSNIEVKLQKSSSTEYESVLDDKAGRPHDARANSPSYSSRRLTSGPTASPLSPPSKSVHAEQKVASPSIASIVGSPHQTGKNPSKLGAAVSSTRSSPDRVQVGKWKLQWFDELQGGRMRHSSIPVIEHSHELRRTMEEGVLLFNQKPQAGIDYLVEKDLIDGDPEGVAHFLLVAEGLKKELVGKYMGSVKPFQRAVMFAYVNRLSFADKPFTEALRDFLRGFRLPGEAQEIDRIMEKFAERYCRDNPKVFKHQDSAYLLAYALIMLNTDAHSVRVKHKMTKKQFLNNCRELVAQGVPASYLKECYDTIQQHELSVNYDYLEQLYARVQAANIGETAYTMQKRVSLGQINPQHLPKSAAVARQLAFVSATDEKGVEPGPNADQQAVASDVTFDFRRVTYLGKLRDGSLFTKYGRKGQPHQRKMWLSEDLIHLCWADPDSNASARRIAVKDITGVLVGRDTTEVFRRSNAIPELKDALCFSVQTHERTLDLEAPSPDAVRLWVNFLTHVVEENTSRIKEERLAQRRALREQRMITVAKQWDAFMFPYWKLYQTDPSSRRSRQFRKVWMEGIPPAIRRRAWPKAIGNQLHITAELIECFHTRAKSEWAVYIEQEQPFLADELKVARSSSAADDSGPFAGMRGSVERLLVDIPETFPQLSFFHTTAISSKGKRETGPGLLGDDLRELLLSYCFYRPDIGYMKGMSHIAAMLLLYNDFIPAFTCFSNLLHSHHFLSFLRMDMSQIKWRFDFFKGVMQRALPALAKHFAKLNITLDMFYLDWCLSLFSKALPLDCASRLWDAYLLEGEVVVAQAGLALLEYHQDRLLRETYDNCMFLLLHAPMDADMDEERFWTSLCTSRKEFCGPNTTNYKRFHELLDIKTAHKHGIRLQSSHK